MSSKIRIQFVHGLESSPHGDKARLFAEHFDALTPAMDTVDFESCVAVHAGALMSARWEQAGPASSESPLLCFGAKGPDVLIGSSFGGAVAVALLMRKLWRGPTLLLAQAALRYDPAARLPRGVRVTLVHGLRDDVVPIEDSRRLAATAPDTATLLEYDAGHRLGELVESGELVELVKRVAGRR
jgi:hypothetical protein